MLPSRLWCEARFAFLVTASLFAYNNIGANTESEFVGSKTCESCHQNEYQLWQSSHHDLAMQEATPDTVLGDFSNQTYTYFDTTSSFYQKDQKYFVKTDGPDGNLATFEVAYVFGVYPLQQYLIEFSEGRYQSLGIAWDTRSEKEGGQRWFHLYPEEEIKHDSPLHWTGLDQNWNYMCAECHSTNLNKNFSEDTKHYQTTWSEIDVSCEACHGPGKNHIAWAQQPNNGQKHTDKRLSVALNNAATWIINSGTGLASRSPARSNNKEIEVCARCHSRRSAQWDEYVHGKPLLDTHVPAALSEDLYHPDGQIDDEVYVYGSFLQSKMYQKGVTCSDCHDPHTLNLKAEGNKLCVSCHLANKFETPTHHFHEADNSGTKCVSCHMPEKTYMVVDPRKDHSFRIPRPDLSLKLGTPNACTQCHQGRSNEWAVTNIEKWYPNSSRRKEIHYGEVLSAGRRGSSNANQLLVDLANNLSQSEIVRASAVSQLQGYMNPFSLTAINDQLHDKKPFVKFSAIGATEALPPGVKIKLLKHLLDDDLRMIRLEAARELANTRAQIADQILLKKLDHSISEYIAAQKFNAERPEAHVNLGVLYANMRLIEQAQVEYKKAITIDPTFISSYINLADLYRAQNLDQEGKNYLLAAIEQQPDLGAAYHALGLLLIRQKKINDALPSLLKATELEPSNTRYKYVYAVALDSMGQTKRAIDILMLAHMNRPSDRDVLYALISFHQKSGDIKQAKHFASILVKMSPWDQDAKALFERL